MKELSKEELEKLEEKLKSYVKAENDKISRLMEDVNCSDKEWPLNRSWFWASKKIDGKYYGYTLYMFGGHVIDIYIGHCGYITYKVFSKDYIKDEKGKLSDIRKKLLKDGKIWTEREKVLKEGISITDWNVIIKNFKEWGLGLELYKKKTKLERLRECIIANYNSTSEKQAVEVFDIESASWIEDIAENNKRIEAKPDMVAVRDSGNGKVLSLIEYKCTEGATKGSYSFDLHFNKMRKYYKLDDYRNSMWKLYKRKCHPGETIDDNLLKESEIVFVISHLSKEDKKGYVTYKTVLNKLNKLKKNKEFEKNKESIKIVVMNECCELKPDMFLSFEEGIALIKEMNQKS